MQIVYRNLFLLSNNYKTKKGEGIMKKTSQETNKKKEIIGFRKACKANGTGLSHYILVDSSKK